METYRFICDNYNPGDEIVLIGFSRGAFTARSVAGMVCALGFLNRAGLDQLPYIFHDYQTWRDWTDGSEYDPKSHLMGFTLGNLERVKRFHAPKAAKPDEPKLPWEGNEATLQKELDDEKVAFFTEMAALKDESDPTKMDLRAMAEAYRKRLAKVCDVLA